MLGWNINVSRDRDKTGSPVNGSLARWQTGLDGIDWIEKLVKEHRAITLAENNGYPVIYLAQMKDVRPVLLEGPPDARGTWQHDPDDIIMDWWQGSDKFNVELLNECHPEEWVSIEAWDES